MKIKSLILKTLAVAAFVASVSVSCSEISFIDINPPADLQSKIDSIAEANKKPESDTTWFTIATALVGAEDNSSGWWTEFSDYFTVSQGKRTVLEFYNHGKGVDNWNNYNVCLATGERDSDGYAEFFVLRSDTYGWGNADYNGAMFKNDYPDVDGDGDIWNDFRTLMQGAYTKIEIDYASAGTAFVYTTAIATDGTEIHQTYEQPVTGTSLVCFLIADGSHMNMVKAYQVPSEIAEIPDEMAASIVVTGTPAAIEVGSEDFWGQGVATVTFTDGSTAVADTADITFVVPDLSTVGTKTILYSYSKTKQGNYGKAVAGTYTLEVTNPIVALEVSANAYLVGGAKYVTLSPGAVKVVAEYADGTSAPLKTSQFTVAFTEDKLVYEGVEGTYEDAYTVTYTSASGSVVEAKGDLVIAKSTLPAQTEMVGLEDNTTPWWAHFSHDWAVAPYEMVSVSMKLGSNEINNWHSPCTILRKADLTEYGVVRMDHFGWGAGYDGIVTATSNWNWETFLPNLDGAEVAITFANNGDNTASVRYHVILANGDVHFQYFDGFAVDSADLQCAIVVEGAHLIFD
ncbi:MAG: hypothetical protein IJN30_03795 [Bacteroidales bacterium]|nr:hypothetical protein [Bacteroidales bacterium]